MNNNNQPLQEYEHQQDEIKKLLRSIKAGLLQHDRNASAAGGRTWADVGDLENIANTLHDIENRLHGTGEYTLTY